MKNLIRVTNIEEPVYLKRGALGYRVVHPTKNPNGSWNLLNVLFGGWENLIILIITLMIILSFFYGVKEMNQNCLDMAKSPCKYTDLDCSRYYNLHSDTKSIASLDYGDVVPDEQ